jgi:3-hydroxyacyl-CoA dehydrogenase/enoyl-CoA hydratase/3-hydroxybutyryl-CoA epimerase
MAGTPPIAQFRADTTEDGIMHLVFDLPGRSTNVFTNAAIHELLAFATWLKGSDEVRGVIVRSGKSTGFCMGADLGELGVAYDMIMAAPPAERFEFAQDHFSPIGRAIRALETAGKPVAAAISGLALGGGCELALGCHYRVMADTPQTALGLPESLVGLLPGGGGTQRMPRLVGLEAALPILLDGARLSPQAALAAGAADEVVALGEEVAAAERWIRSNSGHRQPWDRPEWKPSSPQSVSAIVAQARAKVMQATNGHYPAPLAILDCVERGLPQDIDTGLVAEIEIFSGLIQRPEPRNMIQTLFLGRLDHEKRRKANALPPQLEAIKADVTLALASAASGGERAGLDEAARAAGFTKPLPNTSVGESISSVATGEEKGAGVDSAGLWLEIPRTEQERTGARLLGMAAIAVAEHAGQLSEGDQRLADYVVVHELGFPAYLGGPFTLLRYLGADRLRVLVS